MQILTWLSVDEILVSTNFKWSDNFRSMLYNGEMVLSCLKLMNFKNLSSDRDQYLLLLVAGTAEKSDMWHNNVYIYIYECLWVSVCIRGWEAEEGILYSLSLTQRQNVKRFFSCLSILARRPHKELYPREPARPEVRDKKMKDVVSLEWDSGSRESLILGPKHRSSESRLWR